MKRLIVAAILVGVLATALASTAFAAPPAPQGAAQGQGMGPGNGIHTPGTGLAQQGMGYGPRGGMAAAQGAGAMQGRGAPAWAGQPEEVETLLGMTDAQIQAERLAGKSLAQIAAAKNVSESQLTSTILNAKKADLDKLVADGKLTQAQADYAYSRMQQQVPAMISRTTTGPTWGQGGQANTGTRMGMGMGGRWNR
jgi:hypothetical protein